MLTVSVSQQTEESVRRLSALSGVAAEDVCRVLLVLPLNSTASFPVPVTSEAPSTTGSESEWIDVDVYFPTPVTLAQMADEQRAFLATVTERFANVDVFDGE
jgi:hypothetical protein